MEGGTGLGKCCVDKESGKAVGPLVPDNEASIPSSGGGGADTQSQTLPAVVGSQPHF